MRTSISTGRPPPPKPEPPVPYEAPPKRNKPKAGDDEEIVEIIGRRRVPATYTGAGGWRSHRLAVCARLALVPMAESLVNPADPYKLYRDFKKIGQGASGNVLVATRIADGLRVRAPRCGLRGAGRKRH